MATNPFLENLMQRIAPRLAQMPQMNSQWSQFTANRPLFSGNPGMPQMMQRPMPMIPQINAMPRRRLNGPMQMPRLDPAMFQQAARQATPLFAPPPSAGIPPPQVPVAPELPQAPPPPVQQMFNPAFANSPTTFHHAGNEYMFGGQSVGMG